MSRVVLGCSGSDASTRAMTTLASRYGEVITVTVDVGQNVELADIRDRVLSLGARRAHVIDARDQLVRDFIIPAVRAGGLAGGIHPTAALTLSVIARHIVAMAGMEGSDVVALARSSGAAASLLASLVRALDPALHVVDVPDDRSVDRMPGTRRPDDAGPFQVDANVWGRSIRWVGPGPAPAVPEGAWTLTRSLDECPEYEAHVDVEFESGVPVRINGIDMPLLDMIESLETIAGSHGVGRFPSPRSDAAGVPERYEAPAAVVLHAAYEALRASDALISAVQREIQQTYAFLICAGLWFTPAREAVEAFTAALCHRAAGAVRLRLSKASCTVVGVESRPACKGVELHAVR